jgi:AcrR family transcriptional regulator
MPKGIPLSEEDRDLVRRQIFAAASKLFLRYGFHETSMRQIAVEAGMGKSTLYDYFASKEEILLYFVEEELRGTHTIAAGIAANEGMASDKLTRILHALWEDLEKNRAMAALFTREVARLGETATRRVAQKRLQFRAVLQEIIEQGIAEGEFRPLDSGTTASALHSLMTMPFYDWLRRSEHKEGGAIAEMMIDIFLNGVCKR